MSDRPVISVAIVSDIVCPWCVIGFKRFERVVAAYSDQAEFQIRWEPFELNPWMPPEGQDMREHVRQKYGTSPEQSDATRRQLRAIGVDLGFKFDLGPNARLWNTFDAHRLMHWALQQGGIEKQTEIQMALFTAHFSNGQNISDTDILSECAAQSGFSRSGAAAMLESDEGKTAVREREEYWRDRFVTGVPAFIFSDKYLMVGAQDHDTFANMIERKLLPELA